MQKIGDLLTGTPDSQTGSDSQSNMEKSGQTPRTDVQEAEAFHLPSLTSDPDRDRAIAKALHGPLLAMTPIATLDDTSKREAWRFWITVLRPFPVEWIEDGFAYFARNSGGRFCNPQAIAEIINSRRGGPRQ